MFGATEIISSEHVEQSENGQINILEFEAKCLVRCTECGEQFSRPWRLRRQRHQCRNHQFGFDEIPVRLECKLIHPDAKLPFRKRVTDAGLDLTSVVDIPVPPHGAANVETGLILVAPEGWYLTVEGRSSLWMKGVAPFRGILDATYSGPLMVAMMNVSDVAYQIRKGDRIAQILLHKINHFDIAVVNEISPEYCIRGTAGFGSSGR